MRKVREEGWVLGLREKRWEVFLLSSMANIDLAVLQMVFRLMWRSRLCVFCRSRQYLL